MWCKPMRTLKPKHPGICNVKGSKFIFRSILRNAGMRAALQTVIVPLFPRYLFVAVDMSVAALAVDWLYDWGDSIGL